MWPSLDLCLASYAKNIVLVFDYFSCEKHFRVAYSLLHLSLQNITLQVPPESAARRWDLCQTSMKRTTARVLPTHTRDPRPMGSF